MCSVRWKWRGELLLMEPLSLAEEAAQPLEGVPGTAITTEAAGAPSSAGGRCPNLSESARGEWLPLRWTDYCWLSGSKAGQDERDNWSLLSCCQSSISTQSEGLVYPPTPLSSPPPSPPLVSLVHKKKVIEDEPLTVTPVSRRIVQGLQR